jgi:hypothetical protein
VRAAGYLVLGPCRAAKHADTEMVSNGHHEFVLEKRGLPEALSDAGSAEREGRACVNYGAAALDAGALASQELFHIHIKILVVGAALAKHRDKQCSARTRETH